MRGVPVFGLLALISFGSVNAEMDWWQTMTLYQIYPRSFKDSDGDGIGDLPGIESKLQHLVDSGMKAFWMSPIYPSPMVDFGYDISDFTDVDPIFGTLDDFDNLVATADSLGLKVIMDLVPNHSSDEHEWFVKSLASEDPYTDYYTWRDGTTLENGTRVPPNNWVSVFGGPAWTWRDERQAWYLHQFAEEQPDLNYRNEAVVEEMKKVMVFWLDRGVYGFRIDAVPHLFEDANFPDEPLSGATDDSGNYSYTLKYYTKDQPETYDMVTQWREVMDNYSFETDNVTRLMMIEAYTNITQTMRFYDAGAHFSFNFGFISNIDGSSTPAQIKESVIDEWLDNLPDNATSNWVTGNHDNSRTATRFGPDLVDAFNMMNLLLPGVAVTYNGEEIGMEDQWISWEDTQDPQGCGADEETYESYSRDPARTPFQWDATTSAGFSTNESTWLPVNSNYLTLNLAAQIEAEISHYKVYQALATLRQEPVIQEGTVNVQLLNEDVLGITRELNGSDPVTIVVNFANTTQTISLDVFDSPPDILVVSIASVHSTLTTGSIVSKSGLEIPPSTALVLRDGTDIEAEANTESGSNSLHLSVGIALLTAVLTHLRQWQFDTQMN